MADNYSFDFPEGYSPLAGPNSRRGSGRSSNVSANYSFTSDPSGGGYSFDAPPAYDLPSRPESSERSTRPAGATNRRQSRRGRSSAHDTGYGSDNETHRNSPSDTDAGFLDGTVDGTYMPPSRTNRSRQNTRRRVSGSDGSSVSPLLEYSGGDYAYDSGNVSTRTPPSFSLNLEQTQGEVSGYDYDYAPVQETEGVTNRSLRNRPNPFTKRSQNSYEDDVMHMISAAYGNKDEDETSSTSRTTTGPAPWPMPPSRSKRNETIVMTDRDGRTFSTTFDDGLPEEMTDIMDSDLRATPAGQTPKARQNRQETFPTSSRVPGAAANRSSGNSNPTGGRTTPPESRFSPELVALTISGMNLAEMRKVAKDLELKLPGGSSPSGSTPSTNTGRTPTVAPAPSEDDYELGLDGEPFRGRRGTLGRRTTVKASPTFPATSRPSRTRNEGDNVSSSGLDRRSPASVTLSVSEIPKPTNAAPVRRRWSDETGKFTSSGNPTALQKKESPPPRTPQAVANPYGGGRAVANSEPAARTRSRLYGTQGQEDKASDSASESNDYGRSSRLRRNSVPALSSRDTADSSVTTSTPPVSQSRKKPSSAPTRPSSRFSARGPETPPHKPTGITSPFPASPTPAANTKAADSPPLGLGKPRPAAITPGARSGGTSTTDSPRDTASDRSPLSSSLLGSSMANFTASGRLKRPKPKASRLPQPAVLPDLDVATAHVPTRHTVPSAHKGPSSAPPAPELPSSTLFARTASSNGPSSSQSSTIPTPTAHARPSSSPLSLANVLGAGTTTPSSDSNKTPTVTPPKKTSSLPALSNNKSVKSASPTVGQTNSSNNSGNSVHGAPTLIKAPAKSTSPAKSPSGRSSKTPNRAPSSSTASLLPAPPERRGILERRPVYVKGKDAEKRRKYPRRRRLPNGQRRADWTAPETHYITCLSFPFDFGAVEEEEEEENREDQAGYDDVTHLATFSPKATQGSSGAFTAAGAASTGPGRTTPTENPTEGTPTGANSALVIDEVEKLRKQRRGKGQWDESPLSGSLTPLLGPAGGRPGSRNSDNINDSFDTASYTFMHIGKRNTTPLGHHNASDSSVNRPITVNSRGSGNSVSSGSYNNRSSTPTGNTLGVVGFAPTTVFYEVPERYENGVDDEYEDFDSGEIVNVDA